MKMKKLISAIIALAMCVSLITAMPMSVSAETNTLVSYDFSDGIGDWTAGEVYGPALKHTGYGASNLALGTYSTGVYTSSFDFSLKNVTGTSGTRFRFAWVGSGGIDSGDRFGYWVNLSADGFTLQNTANWGTSSALPLSGEYTMTSVFDLDNNTATMTVTNKGETTALATFTGSFGCDLTGFTAFSHNSDGYLLLDNFVLAEKTDYSYEETYDSSSVFTVTGGETYITFPTATVVTEGQWNATFDFMTDVADGSNVSWRNTFVDTANTRVKGAWVYTEGTSALHVKAGDWNGSYAGSLSKGTWYTCSVTIDYDDTTSGSNARWYIYNKSTGAKLYENWWNATTGIAKLLIQDEKGSGKCYLDNVKVWGDTAPDVDAASKVKVSYDFSDGIGSWTAGEVTDPVLKHTGYGASSLAFGPYSTGVYKSSFDFTLDGVTGTSGTRFRFAWVGSGGIDSGDRFGYWGNLSTDGFTLQNTANWGSSSALAKTGVYTMSAEFDLDNDTATMTVTNKGETTALATFTGGFSCDLTGFTAFSHSSDGNILIDNFVLEEVVPEVVIPGTLVTGGETYIELPAETVVTEGKWTGTFDFMTNVADSANIAWRNTFMMGANNAGGTKVIGAWVYNEGANVYVKAGDWDGSYQGSLSKNTWYTCKVVIDYEDTTSGTNARWYIIERDTGTQKAEYWTNITSSIDRLLIQDERGSGACYVDNVTASVELPEGPGAYEDQEYTFDGTTLPENWAAGTGDGYSITDGQLVLAGSPNWGVDVTFDPNLRESGKYIIGWDYTTQATSFGDYGLFLKLLDSADMSQVKEVFSHMGDGQIHLGNQVFWNISTPTSRMELEVDVDTKEWQLYIDGVPVTKAGGSGVGTWTESLAIGFMNYQHGTCKIDNVTVTKYVENIPTGELASNDYASGTSGWSGEATITNEGGYLKIAGNSKGATLDFPDVTSGVIESSLDLNFANVAGANGSDGTCFLNIGWTNANIDTVPRGGWRFNYDSGAMDIQEHDNWTTHDVNLALDQWYTMKTIIDIDAGTQTVALYTQGGTEAIKTYTKTWTAGTAVANMHMWVRLAEGSSILADNFVLKYKQDVPTIKTVTYSSTDEDVVLATSVTAAVEPDVKAITVELTTAPADYKITDYIKLYDSSNAELAYEYEIAGNTIVITPDVVFAENATYKLTVSMDLYAVNGCQLGCDANYTFETNVGSIKGKLINVTDLNGTAFTTADELIVAPNFKINYKITNTSGDACEILVLRVYYNANGDAVKSVSEYLNFTSDQTSIEDAVTASSDSATGAETVRVFLWNDFGKYLPLCENILLP